MANLSPRWFPWRLRKSRTKPSSASDPALLPIYKLYQKVISNGIAHRLGMWSFELPTGRHAAISAGNDPGMADAAIAGIAKARALTIITRNAKDFEPFGVSIVSPDDAEALG
jgi:hypothetical protein